MSNAQHTPGPWKAFEASWSETFITAPGFDHGICGLDINHATEESQEADAAQMAANANLIAAAPELLDALDCLIHWVQPDGSFPDNATVRSAIKDARAAIAKATGA